MKKIDKNLKPKIAVLMATYNGRLWIEEQVKSILLQESVRVSLFISDDWSTDDTYEYLKKQARIHPQIHLLSRHKHFGNAAQNFFHLIRSVNLNSFDYVALSDQDDIWVEDKLSRAIDHIINFGAVSYSSDVLAFWANGKTKLIKKSQAQTQYDYLFESGGPGCTFVIKRHSINEFKKYITHFKNQTAKILYHDWFIYAFMRSKNFLWVIDSYPGVRYRQHDKNEMGANIGLNASFKRLKFIYNGTWLSQVKMISSLCGTHEKKFINCYLRFKHEHFFSLAFKATLLRRRSYDAFILGLFFLSLGAKKLLLQRKK